MIKALKLSVCSSGTNHVSVSRFEFISASLISMLGAKLTARALLDHLLFGNRLSHSCCHVCTRPIRFTTADGSTRDITYTNTARAPLEALAVIWRPIPEATNSSTLPTILGISGFVNHPWPLNNGNNVTTFHKLGSGLSDYSSLLVSAGIQT